MDNSKIMSNMQMQQKFGRDYDEKQFRDAATKKIRTFKYDPTKPVQIKFKDGKKLREYRIQNQRVLVMVVFSPIATY